MGCCQSSKTKAIKAQQRMQKLKVKPGLFIEEKGDFFSEEYDLEDKLGAGAFSSVFKCREKISGNLRAVKIVSKQSLTKHHVSTSNKLKEIQVLKILDHPNILKIFKGFEDSKNFYILMEFCEGGELFKKLVDKHSFTEREASKIMHQLLSAVAYCHSQKVIHRDLKPENLLIEDNSGEFTIKVADFGNSVIFDVNSKISGVFGSLYYLAPEVIDNNYDEKCDEWSCGVILFMLLTGRPPFTGKTDREIIHNIKHGVLITEGSMFSKVSKEAKDLIHSLMNRNVFYRTTASRALAHPWFKKFLTEDNISVGVLTNVLTNLSQFSSAVKLKSAIYTYIAAQCVSQADVKELNNAFKLLDKNGDGKVSKEELLGIYKQIVGGIDPEKEVEVIMKNADTDGSGFIDYTEFIQASLDKNVLFSKQNLEKAFRLFDKDGNGRITAVEIAEIFTEGQLDDDAVWQEILKQVDNNGDGHIDVKEFQAILLDKYGTFKE